MKFVIAGAAAALVITATARPAVAQDQGDRWSWHGSLAAGKTVEVHDINGSVSAEPASGGEVEVTAIKHAGRHGDPKDVLIREEDTPDGVYICVIYPGRNNRDACSGRGHSRSWGDDDDEYRNDTEVEFTVRVPRGVQFSGNAVNGDVVARGLDSPVEAHSVNGAVDIETSAGQASGESVNGSVHAVVRGPGTEPLRFSSVNGTVDVTLPRDLNADLDASTVNGSITSDFEITLEGGLSMRRQRLRGRIGHGGRTLRVETVNGSIRLRQAS